MQGPEAHIRTNARVREEGWTLTELLIVLAVMGILASLAVPAYIQQQRQARRTDAQVALQQLQMDQLRWRSQHDHYANALTDLGWPGDLSPQGHYRIRIAQASPEGYTLEAWPVGSQSADVACSPMRLSWQGSTAAFSAGAQPEGDPGRCWGR